MGSSFFKKAGANPTPGGMQGLEARAMGANVGAARGAAMGAAKDIGAAQGINKAGYGGPSKRSAAYAPGPKKT